MKMLAQAGLAASLLFAAMPAAAQGDGVAERLADAEANLVGTGQTATGWETRGTLARGASQEVTVKLTKATSFSIIGACDARCDDLNLYATDSKRKLVDSDDNDDPLPVLTIDAPGTYRIRVEMKQCSTDSCAFAVKAFGK
jgi:hypothetical protein